MIIAKNDEAKRSRIWRIVITVSSVLIIIIGIYLLTKMFTTNPLEGEWVDENGRIDLNIKSNGAMTMMVLDFAEEDRVDVDVQYSIDKDAKIITISAKDSEFEKLAEKSEGRYTKEDLKTVADTLTGTFSYSVDKKQLTLSEREYGEQMIFTKK